MSPHVAELVRIVVDYHVASGGTEPDKLRRLVESTCELAALDGQLDGINRVQAGFEFQALLKRMAA